MIMIRKLKLEELNRIDVATFKKSSKIPVKIILENIRSHHNVGSFFRTADAFRIDEIILTGFTPVPPHREINKTALGSTDSVTWRYVKALSDILSEFIPSDVIIGIEQTNKSISLGDVDIDQKKTYWLIFGNEVEGLSEESLHHCHQFIEIPQFGTKHSLNVSVCGGIVMWEFFKFFSNKINLS